MILLLLILFLVQPFASARAEHFSDVDLSQAVAITPEPLPGVDEVIDVNQATKIKQLGKGVRDARTGQVIHLLCIGKPAIETDTPTCHTVGFFLWDPGQPDVMKPLNQHWYHLDVASDSAPELKSEIHGVLVQQMKALKKKRKEDRNQRQKLNTGVNIVCGTMFGLSMFLSVALFGVFGPAMLAFANSLGAGIIWGPIGAGFVFTEFLHHGARSADFVTGPHHSPISFEGTLSTAETLDERKGWNWAIKPHTIKRHKKFKNLLEMLQS